MKMLDYAVSEAIVKDADDITINANTMTIVLKGTAITYLKRLQGFGIVLDIKIDNVTLTYNCELKTFGGLAVVEEFWHAATQREHSLSNDKDSERSAELYDWLTTIAENAKGI